MPSLGKPSASSPAINGFASIFLLSGHFEGSRSRNIISFANEKNPSVISSESNSQPMRPWRHSVTAAKYFSMSNSSRSEEHTSELQSPDHLVCRLLLEKKKNQLKSVISKVPDH